MKVFEHPSFFKGSSLPVQKFPCFLSPYYASCCDNYKSVKMTEEEIAARKFAIASQKENETNKAKEGPTSATSSWEAYLLICSFITELISSGFRCTEIKRNIA